MVESKEERLVVMSVRCRNRMVRFLVSAIASSLVLLVVSGCKSREAVDARAAMHALGALGFNVSNRYLSPRNHGRGIRASTSLIVLHTTEAPAQSSLNKLSERGEAHYCVTEDGTVYRIIDRDREAFHAGRSMWNEHEDVDGHSIGIECVGYHNKDVGDVQLRTIRALVKRLQRMYKIPDEGVVCHAHVAYGAANAWYDRKHRGRKRCGMLFAMPSVRAQLGLTARPTYDPDVKAKRLVQADSYLADVLYGKADIKERQTAR